MRESRATTRSKTNWPVQTQNKARSLKFWILVVEFYCPCSENKGADQLCSYCTADLHLRFRLGKNQLKSGFLMMQLILKWHRNAM